MSFSYAATLQQLALLHPQPKERAEPLEEGIYVRLAAVRDTTLVLSKDLQLPLTESQQEESRQRLSSCGRTGLDSATITVSSRGDGGIGNLTAPTDQVRLAGSMPLQQCHSRSHAVCNV